MSETSNKLINVWYAVRQTQKEVGVWNGTGWSTFGDPASWTILSIAFDPSGRMWCVGEGGNVGVWYQSMLDLHNLAGWNIVWLAFDGNGTMWAVSNEGQVGRWNGFSFDNQGTMGGWAVNMITWDNNGALWCVGNGHVGKWNEGEGCWDDQTAMNSVNPTMIAFDDTNTAWCIGNSQNVLVWTGSEWQPRGQGNGYPGDWWFQSIAFKMPMQVLSVTYDTANAGTHSNTAPVSIATKYVNNTSVQQSQLVTFTMSVVEEAVFSWDNKLNVGMSMSCDVIVPLLEKGSISYSSSVSCDFGKKNTLKVSLSLEDGITINVPPNSAVSGLIQLDQGLITVPYTATVLYNGQQSTQTGVYRGTHYSHMSVAVS